MTSMTQGRFIRYFPCYVTSWICNVLSHQSPKSKLFAGYSSLAGTMKVLNVAEKNDAAKNIAGYLSRGTCRKREGLSVYNKIYEFSVQLWNTNCEMIMTSVSGHLLNHEFLGSYKKWHGCHPLTLFDAPVTKQCIEDSSVKIKKTLEREVLKCAALIIWTDCDREGENIGFEIIQVCQAVKPNIRIYRAKFSEITQTSIQRALQNLGQPEKVVSDAVDVRSELDLRIGAAFTRFQTMRLQKVFPRTLADLLISYGSCQFPTLGFVVERYLAIERFQKEPYWKIKVVDVRNEISVEFRWERIRLFEQLPCQIFLDMCQEKGDATVLNVTKKPKTKWRPLPLDTIELEKQGSRMLHLSAKETMRIAEKLYTQGLISYPRTETNIFPKELNLVPLVQQQTGNPSWGDFAQRLLEDGLTPRAGKKSDQAHPPIHPTKYAENLQGNEAKVYEFVVRHFLACVSRDAVGQETQVEIDIAGEKFHATGLVILEKNYLNVYIYQKWSDKEIHDYKQGEVFRPTSIDMLQEETSPPRLLTEADLITLMDRHGIGTDATHADHIDTIKSRHYVGLVDEKHFMPGKLGIGLVMGYDNMGFQMSKPHLRAELENDLKEICDGRKDPKDVLQSQINKYREVFKIAIERANLIDSALANYLEEQPAQVDESGSINPSTHSVVFKCPKCNADMKVKDRKNEMGKYIGCMSYPACNNAIWFPQTVEGIQVLDETCSQCAGDIRKLKFKLARNAFPLFGVEYITCIGGCDISFNELFHIKPESVNKTTNDTGYGSMLDSRSTTVVSRRAERNTGTGGSSVVRVDNINTSSIPSRNQRSDRDTASRSRNVSVNKRQSNTQSSNAWMCSAPSTSTRNESGSNVSDESKKTWEFTTRENEVFLCYCNEEAKQLTVKKGNLNKGRLFYRCAKTDNACRFFMWGEDPISRQNNIDGNTNETLSTTSNRNPESAVNSSTTWRNDQRSLTNNLSLAQGSVTCNCNQEAKLLTVLKDGPNKGRQFYGCPNGMNGGCNFFQWADENTSHYDASTNNRYSNNKTGRRQQDRNNDRDGGPSKRRRVTDGKRKCGICGVPGHTRKNCPENVMD